MTKKTIGAIILAAGKGTRMKSDLHKVLHPVGGRPMLLTLMDTLNALDTARKVVIVGAGRDQVEVAVEGAEFALQEPQLGTGHAVICGRAAMEDMDGDTLILYGDVPLIRAETLQEMIRVRRDKSVAAVVLGFTPNEAAAYGRLVTNEDGSLQSIVEFKDASDDERAITLCNSGIMCVDNSLLFSLLDDVDNKNAAEEYYLTDLVAVARGRGLGVAVVETSEEEVMGVNSRAELADAEKIFQKRARKAAMDGGVTMTDPDSVFLNYDTVIGRDVMIEPNVVFGPNVSVADGATIYAFSHLEGASVGKDTKIGPFARLRPGAVVEEGAKIGNYVEVKKSTIEAGAKVNHFTYIGDARIGEKANIGAGTITCNYDGFNKYKTDIGAGAFIGSNSSLVAPVTIGDGAIVGAGSVITGKVEADALAVTRADQQEKAGWAARFRRAKQKK